MNSNKSSDVMPNEITVVAAIIFRNGKILIAKRNSQKSLGGKWEFPGGKVENNEAHKEALKRELLEEFGEQFEIGNYVGSNEHQYENFKIHLHAYLVQCNLENIISNEHEEVRWVKKEDILSYDLAEADVPIVAMIP